MAQDKRTHILPGNLIPSMVIRPTPDPWGHAARRTAFILGSFHLAA